ncbi:hypothetical protein HDU97_007497 [Phlyctochytrium planicorne]|nr:hypothetical protein HDU97_007497 [Phlyctochytrium planicorne]
MQTNDRKVIDDNSQLLGTVKKALTKGRQFVTSGFTFCKILNGATFDTLSAIMAVEFNLDRIPEFRNIIDEKAREIAAGFTKKYPQLYSENVDRMACYLAADGTSKIAAGAARPMLKRINRINYFKPVLPALSPSRADSKPYYKFGYIIMISGNKTVFQNFMYLLNELDDGTAFFYLHVDQDSDDLYDVIQDYLKKRKLEELHLLGMADALESNIMFATKRYRLGGNHSSMPLIALLNTYWECLDRVKWEYVINLSVYDLPMRKSREIERLLSLPKNLGRNFIGLMQEGLNGMGSMYSTASVLNINSTSVGNASTAFTPAEIGFYLPPKRTWKPCRQAPTMILKRDFVKFLRKSDDVANLLTYFEHSSLSHEGFFCYVIINVGDFLPTLDASSKHFYSLQDDYIVGINPDDIGKIVEGEEEDEDDDPRYLFALNVDVRSDEGVNVVHWIRENHLEKHFEVQFSDEDEEIDF